MPPEEAGAARSFALELPAGSGHLTLARLFVGAAAIELGCAEESAEDLKLAASEAAAALAAGSGLLRLTVSGADGVLRLAVAGAGTPALEAVDGHLVLGLELARELLGDMTVTNGADGTEISFLVDCPA